MLDFSCFMCISFTFWDEYFGFLKGLTETIVSQMFEDTVFMFDSSLLVLLGILAFFLFLQKVRIDYLIKLFFFLNLAALD